MQIDATLYALNDQLGVLDEAIESVINNCTQHPLNYTYYTTTWQQTDYPPLTDNCGYENLTATVITFDISLTSTLATTQTSSHGIGAVEIFLNEGAILGTVSLFTWFFTIYAL